MCVGGHHADGGGHARHQLAGPSAGQQGGGGAHELLARFAAGPGNDLPLFIQHVANGIDRHQRANGEAAQANRRCAQATPHSPADAEHLAHGGTQARTDVALATFRSRGGFASGMAQRSVGANAGVSQPQVKQHCRRHDGHPGRPHRQTMATFIQPAHDTARGVQPKRAAAGEQHRVHHLHGVFGPQQIGLAGAGCAAANRSPANHALRAEHHRAACGATRLGGVAHGQTRHVGDGTGVQGAGLHPQGL